MRRLRSLFGSVRAEKAESTHQPAVGRLKASDPELGALAEQADLDTLVQCGVFVCERAVEVTGFKGATGWPFDPHARLGPKEIARLKEIADRFDAEYIRWHEAADPRADRPFSIARVAYALLFAAEATHFSWREGIYEALMSLETADETRAELIRQLRG